MKNITLFIFSMLFAADAFAAGRELTCRNTWVLFNNPFEEGLGVYGMYDVDEDSQTTELRVVGNKFYSLSVGQMSWGAQAANMKVTDKDTTVYASSSSFRLMARFYKSQRGVVIIKANGAKKWTPIATFDCSSVAAVYRAEIGHPNVKRIDERRLPKKVLTNIYDVDVGFEMGDGYYDVIANRFYAVTDQRGAVNGYIGWYKLSYTEDPEYPEVHVKFDRNGVRIFDDYNRYR